MGNAAPVIAAFREMIANKNLSREDLHDLIKDGIMAALARRYGPNVEAEVRIDEAGGDIGITVLKEVVETVEDPSREISLEEARWDDPEFEVGDVLEIPVDFTEFGRNAVMASSSPGFASRPKRASAGPSVRRTYTANASSSWGDTNATPTFSRPSIIADTTCGSGSSAKLVSARRHSSPASAPLSRRSHRFPMNSTRSVSRWTGSRYPSTMCRSADWRRPPTSSQSRHRLYVKLAERWQHRPLSRPAGIVRIMVTKSSARASNPDKHRYRVTESSLRLTVLPRPPCGRERLGSHRTDSVSL